MSPQINSSKYSLQRDERDELTSRHLLNDEKMIPRDWKKALRTPHVYRVGKNMFRVQAQFLLLLFLSIVGVMIFLRFYFSYSSLALPSKPNVCKYEYDSTYPLTTPVKSRTGIVYSIAIVSDLDQGSKSQSKQNTWNSYLLHGTLTWLPSNNFISVNWNKDMITLESHLAMKDRGMELSELIVFDGKLLSFDDRTGAVFVIASDFAYPWLILMDGDGTKTKGFKTEWASVKNEKLYVGSFGKEWTTEKGVFMHQNPQWIKVISPKGEVTAINWAPNYNRLKAALNIQDPGYIIIESGVWSDIHRKWFFLPRRCSEERYDEVKDEFMSCNVLLTTDEEFSNVEVTKIGDKIPIRGYSSFKFLPGSKDLNIIALKTEEYKGKTATYLSAFTINGTILLPDTKIMDLKFEGLEFV